MSERQRHYWAYRIDKNNSQPYFATELAAGRLRQGWGYSPEQALPNPTIDAGARRNLPIYHKVKRGDILLVPELPTWGQVALVEATDDFDSGYRFEIAAAQGDYGHTFPARLVGSFTRHSSVTDASLRMTLRTPMRFWNVNEYGGAIDTLLAASQSERTSVTTAADRFETLNRQAYVAAFAAASASLSNGLHANFQASEWEDALEGVLKVVFPSGTVMRTTNKAEKQHGADLLIYVPIPLEEEPAVIAIQVKDYADLVGTAPLDQVDKSLAYFEEGGSGKLYRRWLFITKARKSENTALVEQAEQRGIRLLFEADVVELFAKAAVQSGNSAG